MRALPFALSFLFPLSAALGLWLGGPWTFSTIVFGFVLTPVLDHLLGVELPRQPTPVSRAQRMSFDFLLRLWAPMQLGILGWALFEVSVRPHTMVELVGITLSVGLTSAGGGINAAHELMHRARRLDRGIAEALMASVTYQHFCIEHVLGHHRNVATRDDPATARLGESYWRFLPRCVLGTIRSAWRLEGERCKRAGIGSASLRDRRTRQALTLLAVYGGLAATLGWPAVLLFAAQSVVAILELEAINYVEHYGLRRREVEPGRYESVSPQHSWNSRHRLTGWYLLNLPRHAAHHHRASKPYWELESFEGSPELPAGYATMFLTALVPPLWHRVMDDRARVWSQGAPAPAEPALQPQVGSA